MATTYPLAPLPALPTVLARLDVLGVARPEGRLRVDAFGDSEALSRELLGLIRGGGKRGGASLLWAHEAEGAPVPEAGDIEIVLDHAGEPALITRITRVEVLPFIEVGAAFAASEGEGDGSLAYWRRAHWNFFGRECARIGRTPTEAMPVVCCNFEVLRDLQAENANGPTG